MECGGVRCPAPGNYNVWGEIYDEVRVFVVVCLPSCCCLPASSAVAEEAVVLAGSFPESLLGRNVPGLVKEIIQRQSLPAAAIIEESESAQGDGGQGEVG